MCYSTEVPAPSPASSPARRWHAPQGARVGEWPPHWDLKRLAAAGGDGGWGGGPRAGLPTPEVRTPRQKAMEDGRETGFLYADGTKDFIYAKGDG